MHKILFIFSVLLLTACEWGEHNDSPLSAQQTSDCSNVKAHDTMIVSVSGHYENPAARGGRPKQESCDAYIVDFISDRRMASFKPDQDWVKTQFFGIAGGCEKTCATKIYKPYTADVEIYACASKRDCSTHTFSERVGSYSVYYEEGTRINTGAAFCRTVRSLGAVPTVSDVFGVRIVIKHQLQAMMPPCNEVQDGWMPNELGFNASGTADFVTAGPLNDGGRPQAEATK